MSYCLIWVAPLAGAWIEMVRLEIRRKLLSVAPLAGAWIEMNLVTTEEGHDQRRSPRGSVD